MRTGRLGVIDGKDVTVAAEIIPIQLTLAQHDGVTLWAPQWVEDDEEWEAFLGHEDSLFVFPSAAQVAAFVRSTDEHDLADHPAWPEVRASLADQLDPSDDHRFDVAGVPELISASPDTWALAEFADTIAILHSLAEVCDLDVIDDVLASSAGFALVSQGPREFMGRRGKKLWSEMCAVVADRWGEIVDTLDSIVREPAVPSAGLEAAQAELDAVSATEHHADAAAPGADETPDREPDLDFWDEVGIDCIEITCDGRTGWTLRCFLGDTAVFLAIDGKIQLFGSPKALEEYLADETATNDISYLDAWITIREAITGGEASVIAGRENTYRMDGIVEALLEGPEAVDARALALAVELLADSAQSRGDDEVSTALSSATPLGNLVRAVTDPDPNRMPPSPPFDDEVSALRALIARFAGTLQWR